MVKDKTIYGHIGVTLYETVASFLLVTVLRHHFSIAAIKLYSSIAIMQRITIDIKSQSSLNSMAHVKMLAKQGILTEEEKEQILDGLEGILTDVQFGKLQSFSSKCIYELYLILARAIETCMQVQNASENGNRNT